MKRCIVTGGAGFIGSNLVKRLQILNSDILIIDDFSTGSFANLSSDQQDGFSFKGDIIAQPLSEVNIEKVIKEFQPDIVFHQASITDTTRTDERKMIQENLDSFKLLLEQCERHGINLVWASSAAVYGTYANGSAKQKESFKVDDAGTPSNVYGFSKWLMENEHHRKLEKHPKIHSVGLRYFNVFGPCEENKGHMASMIYKLAEQAKHYNKVSIFKDGEQSRDHIHVNDVVEANIAASRVTTKPGIYNIGSGQSITFNQIVDVIRRVKPDIETEFIDNPYEFYQDFTCADITNTKESIDWHPKHISFKRIEKYVSSIINNK